MSWQGVAVHALFLCVCFNYYCRSPHTLSTERQSQRAPLRPVGWPSAPGTRQKNYIKHMLGQRSARLAHAHARPRGSPRLGGSQEKEQS